MQQRKVAEIGLPLSMTAVLDILTILRKEVSGIKMESGRNRISLFVDVKPGEPYLPENFPEGEEKRKEVERILGYLEEVDVEDEDEDEERKS